MKPLLTTTCLTALALSFNVAPMDIVVWVDTWGIYGYMVAYALVAAACMRYVRQQNPPKRLVDSCALVAIIAMSYVFFANVWPVPEYPLNLMPYLFLACILIALIWYGWLKQNHPNVIKRIGETETDIWREWGNLPNKSSL